MKLLKPHILLFLSLVAMAMLGGCATQRSGAGQRGSLFESKKKRNQNENVQYAPGDYDSDWQSYNWHSPEDLRRAQALADSLALLAEEATQRADNPLPVLCADVVKTAREYLGCRYRAGGNGPDRFDCSGFTTYVFGLLGVTLRRSSSEQFEMGTPIESNVDLRAGDLVFWGGTDRRRQRISHVGIVVDADPQTGNFHFIHAANTGIQIDRSEEPYYTARYRGARRIID